MTSPSRTARLAAFLFVFISAPSAMWYSSVSSKIYVALSPAETAANLLAQEFLFRTSIVSHLAGNVAFAGMMLLFYRLFRPVDRNLSRFMVAPVLAQVAIFVILEVFNIAALMILKSEVRFSFDDAQRQELSFLFLRMHRYGNGASQFLWGLAFIPFGILAYRSGYVPRILAILLIVGGVAYVADTCTYILLQRPDYLLVRPFIRVPMNLGYLIMLWFLVMGIRGKKE